MMFEDDMSKLFEFVQLARPSIFSAVPRYNNIHSIGPNYVAKLHFITKEFGIFCTQSSKRS